MLLEGVQTRKVNNCVEILVFRRFLIKSLNKKFLKALIMFKYENKDNIFMKTEIPFVYKAISVMISEQKGSLELLTISLS